LPRLGSRVRIPSPAPGTASKNNIIEPVPEYRDGHGCAPDSATDREQSPEAGEKPGSAFPPRSSGVTIPEPSESANKASAFHADASGPSRSQRAADDPCATEAARVGVAHRGVARSVVSDICRHENPPVFEPEQVLPARGAQSRGEVQADQGHGPAAAPVRLPSPSLCVGVAQQGRKAAGGRRPAARKGGWGGSRFLEWSAVKERSMTSVIGRDGKAFR
jgi:hypothetical protein